MPRLFYFNPECDTALSSESVSYTPDREMTRYRSFGALIPAVLASPGDAVAVRDWESVDDISKLQGYVETVKRNIEIVTFTDLRRNPARFCSYEPMPWGWDMDVRRLFVSLLGEMPCLPSISSIKAIKALSHRRNTIAMMRQFMDLVSDEIELPMELMSLEEAIEAFCRDKARYFKKPWSSSGLGVLLTDDLEERHVEPWLRGCFNRQHSVMMEKAYKRKLDFATEWMLRDGKADFLGYSVFKASRRGKYHCNISGSQEELQQTIKNAAPEWGPVWLQRQKEAIENLIAATYSGPLGIDMLVTENGSINPCVEMNLRYTMGFVEIFREKNSIGTHCEN